MRADILFVMLVAVVSLARCAPLAAADPAVTPPAAPAALGPEAFSVEVEQIEARRTVHPPGKTRAEYEFDSAMEIQLRVSSTRPEAVLNMRLDLIAGATTDTGENLSMAKRLGQPQRFELGMLTVVLPHPKCRAESLFQIMGTVILHCETVPAKAVELKPISAWLDKPLSIAGGTLTLTALAPSLRYSCTGGAGEAVKQWVGFDAKGGCLFNHKRVTGNTWETTGGSVDLEMPPDGSITITPIGPTVDIAVPFTFRNILLNPPPAPAAEKPLF